MQAIGDIAEIGHCEGARPLVSFLSGGARHAGPIGSGFEHAEQHDVAVEGVCEGYCVGNRLCGDG